VSYDEDHAEEAGLYANWGGMIGAIIPVAVTFFTGPQSFCNANAKGAGDMPHTPNSFFAIICVSR